MSLAALLLGLPGKIRKLRGNNAPKLPLPLPEVKHGWSTSAANPNGYDLYVDTNCPVSTHHYTRKGNNNAVEVSYPVANLVGKGAVDGIWVVLTANDYVRNFVDKWGIEVLLDGVDVTPVGWSHEIVPGKDVKLTYGATPVIGGVSGRICARDRSLNFTPTTYVNYEQTMHRASVPIPFNESLVVNLKHIETNHNTAFDIHCWVNAWLTE